MSKFKGWAVPIYETGLDHTYVTVNDVIYSCFGRGKGGHVICEDTGHSKQAKCIANWLCIDGTAGIVYGVTGVCHQTANRILKPAGITVKDAKGYFASHLLYGTYGKSSFYTRKHHCLHKWPFTSAESVESESKQAIMMKVSGGDMSINEAVNKLKAIELQELISDISGSQLILSDDKFNKIVSLHDEFNIETENINKGMKMMSNSDEFCQHKNNHLNALLKNISAVLTPEEYEKIFKFKVGEEIIVVDPEIMKTSFDL